VKLYDLNGIPILVDVSTKDPDSTVRQKAIKALSSVVRNYPQALDKTIQYLPDNWKVSGPVNAHKMDEVDRMINHMRKRSEEMG
jgi:hsp70-interacting protein